MLDLLSITLDYIFGHQIFNQTKTAHVNSAEKICN